MTATMEATEVLVATPMLPKAKTIKVMHVVKARLHLGRPNQLAPETTRTRNIREWLERLVTLNGRAKYATGEAIKPYLKVERDEAGAITVVTLDLPAANDDLIVAARKLLDPNRPPDPRGNRKKKPRKPKKPVEEQTARERAHPTYLNAYRLVKLIERPNETAVFRFELLRRYSYEEAGTQKFALTTLDAKTGWQRLITTWVRPAILNRLPPALRNGVAQKVAQEIDSNFGLEESGSQSAVGWPDLSDCDPRVTRQMYAYALAHVAGTGTDLELKPLRQMLRGRFAKGDPRGDELRPVGEYWKQAHSPPREKRSPLLFTNSNQLAVWERRRRETNGECYRSLMVSIPVADWPDHQPPAYLLSWRERPDEYTPLPVWSGKKLRPKESLIMLPLSVEGGYRRFGRIPDLDSDQQCAFVQALNGETWQPCWGEIIERDGAFRLHLTLSCEVVPVPRPGLVAVHFAKPDEGHEGTRLYLAVHSADGGSTTETIAFDRIDASRGQRDEWAKQAARRVIETALRLNADIALEQIKGVKKRGQKGGESYRATKFNYSDIEGWIVNMAAKRAQPPVVTWPIYLKADLAFSSHEERAQQVLTAGLALRSRTAKNN